MKKSKKILFEAMKLLFTIFILTTSLMCFAQSNSDDDFVFESNLPDKINAVYQQKIQKNYSIRKDLNPFYLRGDFDGDKKMDYAIGIVDKKTRKKGVLIYHAGTTNYFIIGAGKTIKSGNGGDNHNWMNAWEISDEKVKKTPFKGETIIVEKLESASAIIYWTGKEYSWLQQGD